MSYWPTGTQPNTRKQGPSSDGHRQSSGQHRPWHWARAVLSSSPLYSQKPRRPLRKVRKNNTGPGLIPIPKPCNPHPECRLSPSEVSSMDIKRVNKHIKTCTHTHTEARDGEGTSTRRNTEPRERSCSGCGVGSIDGQVQTKRTWSAKKREHSGVAQPLSVEPRMFVHTMRGPAKAAARPPDIFETTLGLKV